MAHFAKVENETVVEVVVVDNEHEGDGNSYLNGLGLTGDWVKTSYNTRGNVHYGPDGEPDGGTPLRYNYAGIGFTYDKVRDAFIPPKPDEGNWDFNENTCTWDLVATPEPISEQGDD